MFTIPRSKQWLIPALILLTLVLFYRSVVRVPGASLQTVVRLRPHPTIYHGVEIPAEIVQEQFMPARNRSEGHLWPERKYYYTYPSPTSRKAHVSPRHLEPLLRCHRRPNPHTNHIRLDNIVQNVSQATSPDEEADTSRKFNPTIIALPPWSPHQYLLVSRVVTEGLHQESLLCEADSCYPGPDGPEGGRRVGEKNCTADDVKIVGAAGGLRCATTPQIISIPPTPAERCEGTWASFPNIPGFHDPRIFWSGKGEPLIMVNSASRYACVGLWIADLRNLHRGLAELLQSPSPSNQHRHRHPGPLMSYPSLTELTRNPASTRASVEKNWFLFFPTPAEAFVHYDLSLPRTPTSQRGNKTIADGDGDGGVVGGRTFAKLIGNGFTTPNLTDPAEAPCLPDEPDPRGKFGHWHQTSNSLKLVLCRRREAERGLCGEEDGEGEDSGSRTVHFAVMHRKFSNEWDLPLRYERFFVVWDAKPPFRMLGMSRYPILMWNETASGWSGEENWADDEDGDADNERVQWGDGSDASNNGSKDNNTRSSSSSSRKWTRRSQNITTSSSSTTKPTINTSPGTTAQQEQQADSNDQQHSPPQTSHHHREPHNENWAYFTYTPSIAWSWRTSPAVRAREHENHDHGQRPSPFSPVSSSSSPKQPSTTTKTTKKKKTTDGDEDKDEDEEDEDEGDEEEQQRQQQQHTRTLEALNVGYLDDEVVLGIGVDDHGQAFARARAVDLLTCLRSCPGVFSPSPPF